MTTMHTSYGRYRLQRLPLGISSAPEEFQMRLISALEGLEGIICIADDILVFGEGTDFTEAEKDHDRRFVALMERCLQKNIKLNPTKLQFKLTEVKFMGNIITANGMKADPDKERAFNDAKQLIATAPILQYCDLGKPVVLQVDASEEGLGKRSFNQTLWVNSNQSPLPQTA